MKERIYATKISISWFARKVGVSPSCITRHFDPTDEYFAPSQVIEKLESLLSDIECVLDKH